MFETNDLPKNCEETYLLLFVQKHHKIKTFIILLFSYFCSLQPQDIKVFDTLNGWFSQKKSPFSVHERLTAAPYDSCTPRHLPPITSAPW